eukprot:607185-Prymnesium_polylepis.1
MRISFPLVCARRAPARRGKRSAPARAARGATRAAGGRAARRCGRVRGGRRAVCRRGHSDGAREGGARQRCRAH